MATKVDGRSRRRLLTDEEVRFSRMRALERERLVLLKKQISNEALAKRFGTCATVVSRAGNGHVVRDLSMEEVKQIQDMFQLRVRLDHRIKELDGMRTAKILGVPARIVHDVNSYAYYRNVL